MRWLRGEERQGGKVCADTQKKDSLLENGSEEDWQVRGGGAQMKN